MKAKEIILLILIIAAGVFFYHVHTGKIDIDWDWDWDGFFIHLEEYTYEEFQEIEPPLPSLLDIDNAHGDIEIQGSQEEKITVSLQKVIWRKNEEKAKEVANALKMIIDQSEQQLSISTNRNEFRRKNFETHFRISLPEATDIKVKNAYGIVKTAKVGNTDIYNRHGKIIASDIKGELIIENSYRNVEVENVQSGCQLDSKHGNVFVNNVQGNTDIKHRYGKINLENLSQNVKIEGSHTEVFGQNIIGNVDVLTSYKNVVLSDVGPAKITASHARVEVDGARGSLEIHHKYGRVKLNNIQGNLSIEGKNVGVLGRTIVGEKIYISSSYRSLDLAEFSGKTEILLSHGDIELEPSPLTHPIEVKGLYANIRLYWPTGEKYPFEARNERGNIKWNLPAELNLVEENRVTAVKAFSQETEKPSISLSTTYATIRVEEK